MATSYCAGVHAHALPGNHPARKYGMARGSRKLRLKHKISEAAKLLSVSIDVRNDQNCSLSAKQLCACVCAKKAF